MKTFVYKKKIVPVIKQVRCNKCGIPIDVKEHKGEGFIHGCTVEIRHGYGSKHDGKVRRFELCDGCSDDIVKDFALKPFDTEEL